MRYDGGIMARTLKAKRAMSGISQEELSERSGVSIQKLRRWEQVAGVPAFDDLVRVADALKCSVDDFVVQ